ncbi:hypothetical protein K474DRAFT_1714177 [Panus rudis PR-1116 ss-1]|nr:hypothetical protein K474DRAFT_1714177 [Panus rudis PR-1116 ss-1]
MSTQQGSNKAPQESESPLQGVDKTVPTAPQPTTAPGTGQSDPKGAAKAVNELNEAAKDAPTQEKNTSGGPVLANSVTPEALTAVNKSNDGDTTGNSVPEDNASKSPHESEKTIVDTSEKNTEKRGSRLTVNQVTRPVSTTAGVKNPKKIDKAVDKPAEKGETHPKNVPTQNATPGPSTGTGTGGGNAAIYVAGPGSTSNNSSALSSSSRSSSEEPLRGSGSFRVGRPGRGRVQVTRGSGPKRSVESEHSRPSCPPVIVSARTVTPAAVKLGSVPENPHRGQAVADSVPMGPPMTIPSRDDRAIPRRFDPGEPGPANSIDWKSLATVIRYPKLNKVRYDPYAEQRGLDKKALLEFDRLDAPAEEKEELRKQITRDFQKKRRVRKQHVRQDQIGPKRQAIEGADFVFQLVTKEIAKRNLYCYSGRRCIKGGRDVDPPAPIKERQFVLPRYLPGYMDLDGKIPHTAEVFYHVDCLTKSQLRKMRNADGTVRSNVMFEFIPQRSMAKMRQKITDVADGPGHEESIDTWANNFASITPAGARRRLTFVILARQAKVAFAKVQQTLLTLDKIKRGQYIDDAIQEALDKTREELASKHQIKYDESLFQLKTKDTKINKGKFVPTAVPVSSAEEAQENDAPTQEEAVNQVVRIAKISQVQGQSEDDEEEIDQLFDQDEADQTVEQFMNDLENDANSGIPAEGSNNQQEGEQVQQESGGNGDEINILAGNKRERAGSDSSLPGANKTQKTAANISKGKGKEREHTPVPTEPTPQAPQDKNIPDTDMSWSHIPPTQTGAASVAPTHRTARSRLSTKGQHVLDNIDKYLQSMTLYYIVVFIILMIVYLPYRPR